MIAVVFKGAKKIQATSLYLYLIEKEVKILSKMHSTVPSVGSTVSQVKKVSSQNNLHLKII